MINTISRKAKPTVVGLFGIRARAANVSLPGVHDRHSGMASAMELATQMVDAFSSTAQDLNRGRVTEIDALNGYISRRGAELGIPVVANHALFTLVKLAEMELAKPGSVIQQKP